MHLKTDTNPSIEIDIVIKKAIYDDLYKYINDNSGEFAINETKFGEVPIQEEVGHNIDKYLEYSLAIKNNKKLIGIIFLKCIYEKTVELSIIIKKEYRNRNLLKNLLILNKQYKKHYRENFLEILSESMDGYNIVTSVTKGSFLEKILLDLNFIFKEQSLINNKALYSFK